MRPERPQAFSSVMRHRFVLSSVDAEPVVTLRTIVPADLERLRLWKNAFRTRFFFRDEITPEMQLRWYEGYLDRAKDFMFIGETGGMELGCVGFRVLGEEAEIYNIIGARPPLPPGSLEAGFRLLCTYIRDAHAPRIVGKILKDNPVLPLGEWLGFRLVSDRGDHWSTAVDWERLAPCRYSLRSLADEN